MAKRRRTADEIVREVQLAARQQVIDRVDDRGMAEVAEAWAPHFEQLRDRLLNSRPHEIHEVIDATMRELARATVRPAQRSIRQGAIIGMNASDREHEALVGQGGPIRATIRQAASIPSAVSRERAREIAQERIRGTTSHGGVRLSTRLHRQAREVGEHATSIVRSSIEARVGMHEAAEEFLGVARTQMQLAQPRYLERIVAEARRARDTGDRTRLLEVIEGHRGQLNRLGQGRDRRDGEYSLRSTVRQFVNDVQMRPEDVDALLARHMEDRAQFVARRIMRHETAEAMRTAHLEGLAGKPYVKGIRWTLSPAHPRPDVCDLYAAQALHGLGPGGYPLESVPETPHPLCLCSHESILDEEHFTRQAARRRGEPEPPRTWEDPTHQSAHDWLAEQPESFRRQVLGPTRATIFDQGPAGRRRVIDGAGHPIPVSIARATHVEDTRPSGWPRGDMHEYDSEAEAMLRRPAPRWAEGRPTDGEAPPWTMRRRRGGSVEFEGERQEYEHERRTTAYLVAEGNRVVVRDVVRGTHRDGARNRNADLDVNGIATELKALLSGGEARILDEITKSLARSGQARNIVYDLRGATATITSEDAERIVRRLRGKRQIVEGRLDFVRLIGKAFDLTWDTRPQSTSRTPTTP